MCRARIIPPALKGGERNPVSLTTGPWMNRAGRPKVPAEGGLFAVFHRTVLRLLPRCPFTQRLLWDEPVYFFTLEGRSR